MKYLTFVFILLIGMSCSNTTSSDNNCNKCQNEGLFCDNNNIYDCSLSKNGCLVKTVFETCGGGYKCDLSTIKCIPDITCSNECNSLGAFCSNENSVVFCGQFNEDSCYEYSDIISCENGEICREGECILDIIPCERDSDCNDINAKCQNIDEIKSCVCKEGYLFDSNSETCENIIECNINNGGCDINAECEDTMGSFNCKCNEGFSGDGFTCNDLNECLSNDNNCSSNAKCINLDDGNGYECECNQGYEGDGTECLEVCGNGIKTPSEQCDDGNDINDDECSNNCKSTTCGDGAINNGEQCDDGNDINDDACLNTCIKAVCGDGAINNGEQCDDGNDINNDACLNNCTKAVCGDGAINNGEQCDDGNTNDNDGCSANCIREYCGDTIINNSNENCDDGNTNDNDGCSANCITEYCGDGIINNSNENCDDGNAVAGDGCSASCITEYCGDGVVNNNNTEQCDDGNDNNDDGCSNDCIESDCGCNTNNTFNGDNSCNDTGQCNCLPMYKGQKCNVERKLKIYVTSSVYNGNLGGVRGADEKCNNLSDSNYPNDGYYYKALIGASEKRDKNKNWVLEKDMDYYRSYESTLIDTTDSQKKFTFNFDNSINETKNYIWTGLNNDSDNYISDDNCDNWNSSDNSFYGDYGISNRTGSSSIIQANFYFHCNREGLLYCVEQVCPKGQAYNLPDGADSTHGVCVGITGGN